jgi:hypothetical protein
VSCGGIDPFALIVYAGVGVDGFYQALGGGDDVFGSLNDEFESGAKMEVALFEQVEGAGVTVNCSWSAVGLEVEVDVFDPAPLKEGFFDGFTVRMVADGAASFMVREVNFILGFGLALWSQSGGVDGELFDGWDWAGLSFGAFSWFGLGLWCGRFGVSWRWGDGNHDGIASFFEGFYGGFEGGEAVEQVDWFFGCRVGLLGWRVRRIGWGSLGDQSCLGGCGVSNLGGCVLSRPGELVAGIRLV